MPAPRSVRLFTATIAVAMVSWMPPSNATAASQADEAEPSRSDTVAGLELGERAVISGDEVEQARDDVADDTVAVGPALERSMERDLVQESEEQGIYLDAESIDVLPLLDGEAVLALPVDTKVEEINISLSDEGVLDATLATTGGEGSNASLSGPGMAATKVANGEGTYKLKIISNGNTMADGFFTWKRWKLTNDGEPNKLNFVYKRFGDIQLAALSGQPDPRTDVLRIQSFPFDGIENDLIEWNKYSPASDRDDDCSSYTASINVFGLGFSAPFDARCGTYNMWRNIDNPGSYWLQYQGGGGGNREVSFLTSWAQKKDTTGSMHDLNQIKISFPFPSPNPNMSCTQTDTSKTCDGED
jgi:hypothetical protein